MFEHEGFSSPFSDPENSYAFRDNAAASTTYSKQNPAMKTTRPPMTLSDCSFFRPDSRRRLARCVGLLIAAICAAILVPSQSRADLPLLGQWLFEEGTGGKGAVTADNTANGNDLTLSSNNFAWGTGVDGKGGAFKNTATSGNWADVTRKTDVNGTFDNLTSYTITGWFKREGNQTGNNGAIISLENGLTILSTNDNYLWINSTNAGAPSVRTANNSYARDEWVFFAVTVNSSASSLLSGISVYFGTATTAPVAATGLTVGTSGSISLFATGDVNSISVTNRWNVTGTSSTGALINTFITDLRIYGVASGTSGALGADDIRAIWAQTAAVPEPATVAVLLGLAVAAFVSVGRIRSRLRA